MLAKCNKVKKRKTASVLELCGASIYDVLAMQHLFYLLYRLLLFSVILVYNKLNAAVHSIAAALLRSTHYREAPNSYVFLTSTVSPHGRYVVAFAIKLSYTPNFK